MAIETLPVVDLSARDFASIRRELILILQQLLPNDFTDFTESALGIALIEAIAHGIAAESFYADRRINEVFLETARERASVIRIASLIGYQLAAATSASANLNVNTGDLSAFVQTIIAAGASISARGGQVFETLEQFVINRAGIAPAFTYSVNGGPFTTTPQISVVQGESQVEAIVGDGVLFQRYLLDNSPVISGSFTVRVDSVLWTQVEALALGDPDDPSNNEIYEVRIDEFDRATIRFGDGITGDIPGNGSIIDVTYRVGGGESGNVGAGSIAGSLDALGDAAPVTIGVTNPGVASGGRERETIENARFFAPRSVKVLDTLVTENDYRVTISTFAGTAGAVTKAGIVVDPSDGISNVIKVYIWTADANDDLVAGGSIALKEEIEDLIDSRKVVTVEREVLDGLNTQVDITVLLRVAQGFDETEVQAAVLASLQALFRASRTRFENILRFSTVYDTLAEVLGVQFLHIDKFAVHPSDDPSVSHDLVQPFEGTVIPIETGTLVSDGGGADTFELPLSSEPTDDFYCSYLIKTTGGTGAGQIRKVSGYVGATRVGTVEDDWSVAVDATTTYEFVHERLVRFAGSTSSLTPDFFRNRTIAMTAGASLDQVRTITEFGAKGGITDLATIQRRWTRIPELGDSFVITPDVACEQDEAIVAGALTITILPDQELP